MSPKVPYYSTSLFDPRERPVCDAGYSVDDLRHTVQFAAAVQAAFEADTVFAELSPHPLLTHTVEQTARSLDMSVVAMAGMRREQPLPHGLRGLLSDLHSADAAVDFSVLYPAGQLVDAPLPAWTHRPIFLDLDGQEQQTQGASTIAVHPLLGAHVRLPEEPERHVWPADVGTSTLPWLTDHQVHAVPPFPGPPTVKWRWPRPARCSARRRRVEVREPRVDQMLLLDDETPIERRRVGPGVRVVDFEVETNHDGENTRRATAALRAPRSPTPPSYDVAALLAAHPSSWTVTGCGSRSTTAVSTSVLRSPV